MCFVSFAVGRSFLVESEKPSEPSDGFSRFCGRSVERSTGADGRSVSRAACARRPCGKGGGGRAGAVPVQSAAFRPAVSHRKG